MARIPDTARKWRLVFLSICVAVAPAMDKGVLLAQEPPEKMVYQDFRNKRPLLPSLDLIGSGVEDETRAEAEGLRITLPAERAVHRPTEVAATFVISGDFEITGTYEFLSGARPKKGYGAGVHLNIADSDERIKFAQVRRGLMPREGSVHGATFWLKKKDYQERWKPSEAKAGQLRLTRIGASLRYLVSDAPGEKFREIWFQEDFGKDDIEHVRYGVSDSGEPGNPVDARLIDLRIRMGRTLADKAFDPAPLAPPEPLVELLADPAALPHGFLLAIGAMLALSLGLGVWFYLRRRWHAAAIGAQASGGQDKSTTPQFIICACCGKKLKITCPHCGTAVAAGTAQSDG